MLKHKSKTTKLKNSDKSDHNIARTSLNRQALDRQVNYAGMLWLLAAQIMVMLPFLAYLPIWIILALFICAGWRIRVLRGHWSQPHGIIKAGIITFGVGALALSGVKPLSLDAMSSLLLLGFAFKSLEVIHKRDAIVVIFIGYFLVAVQFLYNQSIGAALYGLVCLTLLTAALIAVQQSAKKNIAAHLKLAATMLAQCLPLMLVLYLFFPRLPPLWSVSLPSNQATTGISDSMAPGDIAQLSQSDATAFRITFKGPKPKQHQLYWRGLVLNHFDGREWTQFSESLSNDAIRRKLRVNPALARSELEFTDKPIEYEAIYEATEQPWLFTLSPVSQWSGDAQLGFDFRLMAEQKLHAPFALSATSYIDAIRDFSLNPSIRQLALQLPEDQNPRARNLAKQWRSQSVDEKSYVRKVMDHFREQEFYYTLRPPLTGPRDTIDRFLFESQRGFCSHYAGSFVFMMRAVGIPARVVVGYQGGEWNEEGNFLTIHQYDAHAWTEVWLEGSGWNRLDPTGMVAPDRIEQDLETAMQAEGSFLEQARFSTVRIKWLTGLRQKWDAVEYGWRRWVLGYDNDTQLDLLQKWLGEVTMARVGLAVSGVFAAILLFWLGLLGITRKPDKTKPGDKLYRGFCKKLEKKGLKRPIEISAEAFAQVAIAKFPESQKPITEITQLYQNLSYREVPLEQHSALLTKMKSMIKTL